MKISVIIPTYRRNSNFLLLLKKNLSIIKKYPEILEIIIVDDNEKRTFYIQNKNLFLEEKILVYLNNGHVGSSSARNAGINKAKGEIILFIDDDILLTEHALHEHIYFHMKNMSDYVCLVGSTLTPASIYESDTLNQWVIEKNIQFGDLSSFDKKIDYRFFYTCNLSIKKAFLIKNGIFDKLFSEAIYDDIELGYRLEKQGLKIYFEKKCISYHLKKYTLEGLMKRCRKMGIYAKKMAKKHPEMWNTFIQSRPTLKEIILIYIYPILRFLNIKEINRIDYLFYKSIKVRFFFEGFNK